MSDYCLHIRSYARVFPSLFRDLRDGHSYAHITLDAKKVVDLERPVDAEFLATLPEDDRTTYQRTHRDGDTTSRLLSEEEAERLAVAWMKEHAPNGRLVDSWYNMTDKDRILYEPARLEMG